MGRLGRISCSYTRGLHLNHPATYHATTTLSILLNIYALPQPVAATSRPSAPGRAAVCVLVACLPLLLVAQAGAPPASGDAVIRGKVGESEIVITTTSRLAGAIDSLTWNGREFIDSYDHGRQLQSASNFDAGGQFIPETFNPTEAGSSSDGRGPTSTSRLLHLVAGKNQLQTTTQMAFWLRPDEKSLGNPARNKQVLSNHLLTKRVTIGYFDIPNVIVYDVTFALPIGERHRYAQFEVVTGYMPPEFSQFWTYDPANGLKELSDGPGEQPLPVILSTADGKYAMGVFSPPSTLETPGIRLSGPGYGRFRFEAERVVKWNSVFRLRSDADLPAADYSFCNFVAVGTREMVQRSLHSLYMEFVGLPDSR